MTRVFTIVLFLLCLWPSEKAQSTAPEVLGSAGNHFSTPSAYVSWTISEPVTITGPGSMPYPGLSSGRDHGDSTGAGKP